MGTNLQILFFISIVVLQVVLITVTIKGLKVVQRTMGLLEQKVLMTDTRGYKQYGIENEKGEKKHTEKQEVEDLQQSPGEEELLFIKQVELNKTDPIMEVNIIADRKEK